MRASKAAACVVLAMALLGAGGTQRSEQTLDADQLVARWLDAVRFHVAGQPDDDALKWLASLTPDAWKLLNAGLKRYFGELGQAGRVASNGIIARAAVLHLDAARFDPVAPAELDGSGWTTGAPPPLVRTLDGESLGSTDANWHWILARQLVDLMYPSPRDEPFVPAWYHAAAAYMLERGLYGEVSSHLDRAAALLPNDARILFDRACLAEALGLPRSQFVMEDLVHEKEAAANRQRSGSLFVPGQSQTVAVRSNFPTTAQANAEAERLFRRTLEVDPTFVEARVRLGRLLDVRGKHDEAAAELATALADSGTARDPVLGYDAHLFAARAARALGQTDRAIDHVRRALALFPNAQTALIVRSELALAQADADEALAPIRRLAALPSNPARGDDPWWMYDMGPGRQTELLVSEMLARLDTVRK